MKKMLLTDWHFARIFRVGVGLISLVYGFTGKDNLLLAAGAFLVFMGVTNTGCGAGGCGLPGSKKDTSGEKGPIQFEEVK